MQALAQSMIGLLGSISAQWYEQLQLENIALHSFFSGVCLQSCGQVPILQGAKQGGIDFEQGGHQSASPSSHMPFPHFSFVFLQSLGQF